MRTKSVRKKADIRAPLRTSRERKASLVSKSATEHRRKLKTGHSPTKPYLTGRERQVLRLVAEGCANKEIADMLSISPETVHRHLENIFHKLHARNRTDAVRILRERA